MQAASLTAKSQETCQQRKINTQRLQIIGVAISPAIANPNGPHGRAGH
jgi:hypothetical protein